MKLIKHEGLKRLLQVVIAISVVVIVWSGFARDYEPHRNYLLVTPEHTVVPFSWIDAAKYDPKAEFAQAHLPWLLSGSDYDTVILFRNAADEDIASLWDKVSPQERAEVGKNSHWHKRRLIAASIGWGLAYLSAISLAFVLLVNAFAYVREGFRTAGKPSLGPRA